MKRNEEYYEYVVMLLQYADIFLDAQKRNELSYYREFRDYVKLEMRKEKLDKIKNKLKNNLK